MLVNLVQLNRGFGDNTIRKIAAVLPATARTPVDKTRISVWSHSGKSWSNPKCVAAVLIVGPAPEDWKQTRAARKAIAEGRRP